MRDSFAPDRSLGAVYATRRPRICDRGFADGSRVCQLWPPQTRALRASPLTRVEVLGNIGPNWFASVMGTGIVATAGATLPVHVWGLRAFAEVVWVIAAVLLAVLLVVVGGHWLRHPTVARGPRPQSTDGALLRRTSDGTDDGRGGRGAGRQGPDRRTHRRRPGLGAVDGRHAGRPIHGGQDSIPDVHPVRRRARRGVRRMVDAGGSARWCRPRRVRCCFRT